MPAKLALCLTVLLLLSATLAPAAPPLPTVPGLTQQPPVEIPAVQLRGYGRLGGSFAAYKSPAGEASVLRLDAADAAHAGLVLAKYRSDLHNLGSGADQTLAIAGQTAPAYAAPSGLVLATRAGSTVWIVTAPDAASVSALLLAAVPGAAGLDFTGAASVPTYLDKWDKWGFGFWFPDPLRTPEKQEATYDVRERIAWAQKMQVGLQFYLDPSFAATGEGIVDEAGKHWAADVASGLGLPVFVQGMSDLPAWVGNRFPEQMQMKVPEYVGNWYGPNGWNGWGGSPYNQISWASQEGLDSWLATFAPLYREYAALPTCTGYGEWHGEVGEGPVAMMMDYGPYVDGAYRRWLRGKYQTPTALDKRWVTTGRIKSWDDVRLPEPANFLGWGPGAVDLKGEWRRQYQERLSADQQKNWGAVDLDDTAWQSLTAPGDDHQIYQEIRRRPTIFRRSFDLTADQLDRLGVNGKIYLYVWTLDDAFNDKIQCVLNGKPTPDSPVNTYFSWGVTDVTAALQVGHNSLALRLPWGYLSYRVYLSPEAPRCYPDLAPGRDAQWTDYRDFIAWMREDCLRRGIEAIRREDPDKPIKLYAPGSVVDIMKNLAEDYGCYWHDTGGMSGNWDDLLTDLIRSAGKQMSIEPGNAADDLPSLKAWFGNWCTEGLNAVDYFADIADIMWRPDQKAWFEAHQPTIHLIGKYHYPPAQVATLFGARSARLTGWPWSQFNTELLWMGRKGPMGAQGSVPDPRDVITETDFARGNAAHYHVIIDDNTFIMDDDLVDQIEAWVKAGGIFIAGAMTGRHSTTAPNTWKLARLTGYKVIGGNDNWRVAGVPGQTVFTDPKWNQLDANGTPVLGGAGSFLQKVDPTCVDLAVWAQGLAPAGAVAIGWRPLGQGRVITVGSGIPWGVPHAGTELLEWCGISVSTCSAPGCRVKHFITNNGLQDLWMVVANGVKDAGPATLTLTGDELPTELTVVGAGTKLTGVPGPRQMVFSGLAVEPAETYALLAPRAHLAPAPLDWLRLQREWWGGTKPPAPAPAIPHVNNTLDLSRDWLFSPVPAGADAAATAATAAAMLLPGAPDKDWTHMILGVWYSQKFPDVKQGVFRKHFTVPAAWAGKGRLWLWIRGSWPACLLPPYQVQGSLDGKEIWNSKGWMYSNCIGDLTAQLTPGPHLLALNLQGNLPASGIAGEAWLEFIPDAPLTQSLAGNWGSIQVPGKGMIKFGTAKFTFTPDPAGQGKQAVLYVEATANNVTGLYLNGRQINRETVGQHFRMNLTEFIRWGQPNTIELIDQWSDTGVEIKTIEMRYYDKGQI